MSSHVAQTYSVSASPIIEVVLRIVIGTKHALSRVFSYRMAMTIISRYFSKARKVIQY